MRTTIQKQLEVFDGMQAALRVGRTIVIIGEGNKLP
jgi:hypothetical protein